MRQNANSQSLAQFPGNLWASNQVHIWNNSASSPSHKQRNAVKAYRRPRNENDHMLLLSLLINGCHYMQKTQDGVIPACDEFTRQFQ